LKWLYKEDSSLIHSKDAAGNNAIIIAVQFGHFEILKWLLSLIPDAINHQNAGGDTGISSLTRSLLFTSAQIEHTHTLILILSKIVRNSLLLSSFSSTLFSIVLFHLVYVLCLAALIASKEFRIEILLYLISCGADIDIKDRHNKRCIDYLSRNISRAPEIDGKVFILFLIIVFSFVVLSSFFIHILMFLKQI
jgi:ankyrin repeat protein